MRALSLKATLVFAALAFASPGRAEGPMPSTVPAAPSGTDGVTAAKIVGEVEALAAKDAEIAKVVGEAVKKAKLALERAHGARAAGDHIHARMLDGLALDWAETASEQGRAAAAERAALETTKKAHEVGTATERARALLEETQAKRGRVAAELEHVEAEAKEARKVEKSERVVKKSLPESKTPALPKKASKARKVAQ